MNFKKKKDEENKKNGLIIVKFEDVLSALLSSTEN